MLPFVFNLFAQTADAPPMQAQTPLLNGRALILVAFVLVALSCLVAIGRYIKRQPEASVDQAIIRNFNKRVTSWLIIFVLLVVSVWVILGFTPLQYVLVGLNAYELFTVVIPVYASLFIPARIAFTSDHKGFLERAAKIQFGLLICVYALSHTPALLYLNLYTWDSALEQKVPWQGSTAGLLFFFIMVVQFSDMLHFVWDRTFGKHVIAPTVNATKTWEGLIGTACCTALTGMLVQRVLPVTPFTWYGAGFMALLISVMASSGSMTMSAIKRDRGVTDYGTLVQGHAGVLDRIDSICFAAPIFFHATRFFLGSN